MIVRRAGLLLVVGLLLSTTAAFAAERVTAVPPVTSFISARFEVAPMVVNGRPVMVGRGEMASPSRAHLVLQTLPGSGQREQTLEIIVYDGTTYVREDTSPQWYVESTRDVCCIPPADQSADSVVEAFGTPAAVTKIGSMPIAGAPTDQYQVWFGRVAEDPPSLDHITLDFWIGQQINYVYQLQVSFYEVDPELGSIRGAFVQRFYDFNASNIVVRPPADAVARSTGSARLVSTLRGSAWLRTVLAPLGTPELRALAVRHVER